MDLGTQVPAGAPASYVPQDRNGAGEGPRGESPGLSVQAPVGAPSTGSKQGAHTISVVSQPSCLRTCARGWPAKKHLGMQRPSMFRAAPRVAKQEGKALT